MTSISQSTLSTGTAVVIEANPGVESVAMVWFVPAGVAHDPSDHFGIYAFWAELLLRGSKNLDSRAQADAFDRLGTSRSAQVTSRFLTIGATTLGVKLAESLPLLVDMVRQPRFDDASIEPSRELCLQAIESLKDDPGERAALGVRARHLAPPFNRSTLGTVAGLNAITADYIRNRWPESAVPAGSIIAIAGRVDAAAVIEQLETLLSDWIGTHDEPTPDAKPPRGCAHEIDDSNQVQIILMHDAPA